MRFSKSYWLNNRESLAKSIGLTVDEVNGLCNGTLEDYARECFSRFNKVLSERNISSKRAIVEYNTFTPIVERVWYFKRSLHFITAIEEDNNELSVDLSALDKMGDKAFIIDTKAEGVDAFIRVHKMHKPLVLGNKEYWWNAEVVVRDRVDRWSLFLRPDNNVKRVFIGGNGRCKVCDECNKCTSYDMVRICSLKSKNCLYEPMYGNIRTVLLTIKKVVESYISVSKNPKKCEDNISVKEKRTPTIHVAHDESDDRETVLTVREYIHRERIAEKYVPKGGHHKSPCEHTRSSHYRYHKGGNYIYDGSTYKFVGKSFGEYIRIKETVVNKDKDTIVHYIIK